MLSRARSPCLESALSGIALELNKCSRLYGTLSKGALAVSVLFNRLSFHATSEGSMPLDSRLRVGKCYI